MARDRLWVLLVVATLALLAWADLLAMGGMEDPTAGWSWTHFAAVLAMWVVMMAAMMIPSALPAILLFQSLRRTFPGPATLETLAFSGGYVATWTGFSVLAAGAQGMLAHATLLTPAMASASVWLTALLFGLAGIYQFSKLKNACLAHCRSPAQFIMEHHRKGVPGAFLTGAHHGVYCVGCCWALMLLLFAVGVMNLAAVAAITALVLFEKTLPAGPRLAAGSGVALVLIGAAFILA